VERHAISSSSDHRTRAEQLVEAHLAVENVAANQAEAALQVERRMDLPADHRLGKAGRMAVHHCDDRISSLIALLVPGSPSAKVVTEMLAEQTGDVLALGRKR